jgi:hypothetical protein
VGSPLRGGRRAPSSSVDGRRHRPTIDADVAIGVPSAAWEPIDTERATPEGDRAAYGNLAQKGHSGARSSASSSPLGGHRLVTVFVARGGMRRRGLSKPATERSLKGLQMSDLARMGSSRPTRPTGFEPVTFGSVDQRSRSAASANLSHSDARGRPRRPNPRGALPCRPRRHFPEAL